jgi:alpha-mannosidase
MINAENSLQLLHILLSLPFGFNTDNCILQSGKRTRDGLDQSQFVLRQFQRKGNTSWNKDSLLRLAALRTRSCVVPRGSKPAGNVKTAMSRIASKCLDEEAGHDL